MLKLYENWFPILTCCTITFTGSIMLFLIVSRMDPGYTKPLPVNEFYKII